MENFINPPALKVSSFQVFDERSSYINLSRIYFAHFNKIPSIKFITQININKFKKWLESQSEYKIETSFFKERFVWQDKKLKEINTIYLLSNEIVVDIEDDVLGIAFLTKDNNKAQIILDEARKYRKRNKSNHLIHLVVPSYSGDLDTKAINLSKPKLEINKNYNDDLVAKHSSILKILNKKNKSGLILFYGEPGTGKSTYIRYLVHSIKKDILFISPKMAANLDAPGLTKLLIENANNVFVIEDAEDLIVSRENEHNSSISMLLNLTDGLLGDSLGIKIIATFNTHISNVDRALLRKGRLSVSYEFKPLTIEKSKQLLAQNGTLSYMVNKPMTLAEIYNLNQEGFQYKQERQSIGFMNKAI